MDSPTKLRVMEDSGRNSTGYSYPVISNRHTSDDAPAPGQNNSLRFAKFIADESGLTIVEYAVAAGLVGVGILVAFTDLGTTIADFIRDLKDAIEP